MSFYALHYVSSLPSTGAGRCLGAALREVP